MPVEDADFISELVPTDPAGGETLGQADDHLRVIKKTITNTFIGGDGDAFDKALEVGPDYLNDLPNKLDDYVTLTGDQTVAGVKTFADDVVINKAIVDGDGDDVYREYDVNSEKNSVFGSGNTVAGLYSSGATDIKHYYGTGNTVTTDILTVANFAQLMPQIVDVLFPVGAFYMSYSDTNPSTHLGGTWETRAGARFLIGVGSATDKNGDPGNVGSPGTPQQSIDGEYNVTLTAEQMPNHTHGQNTYQYSSGSSTLKPQSHQGAASPDNPSATTTDSWGGGQSHTNVPPYYGMYVWQRVA